MLEESILNDIDTEIYTRYKELQLGLLNLIELSFYAGYTKISLKIWTQKNDCKSC